MPKYSVTVRRKLYEDHPLATGYDIEAPNYHDAEKEARQRFEKDWGVKYEDSTAFTIDKHQIDYRHQLNNQQPK